jgi:endonuclease/exonuclease/phosphatase family metal-dependent hydrolase
MEDPGPFARVLRVLDPDVVLLQEWTSRPHEIAAWLNASVPLESGEWSVRMTEGWGVAVASRHPVQPLGHEELYLDGEEDAIRFAGALVDTPLGYLAASSVHLKCCGASGSSEDHARISEAGAINRSLSEALAVEPVGMRVIAGDFNLVGSRPPIDVMRNGLDADGSDLEIADARVLGDAAYMTWRDDANPFTPGRLDFTLVGDAGAEIVRAFVLDTRGLSDRALDAAGLDRTDSAASDHMPLVVDLRPR